MIKSRRNLQSRFAGYAPLILTAAWELKLSRIVKPESAGKDRNQLSKGVVLAIRELSHRSDTDDTTRDLAAFIGLALTSIADTIDISVDAWEKRGYWVKSERFRMEWEWAGRCGRQMCQAVLQDDWGQVAALVVQIGGKLAKIEVAVHNRLGKPWEGAYAKLKSQA